MLPPADKRKATSALTLDDCVPLIQEMTDVAKKINPDIIVICHGGPIAARPKPTRLSVPSIYFSLFPISARRQGRRRCIELRAE